MAKLVSLFLFRKRRPSRKQFCHLIIARFLRKYRLLRHLMLFSLFSWVQAVSFWEAYLAVTKCFAKTMWLLYLVTSILTPSSESACLAVTCSQQSYLKNCIRNLHLHFIKYSWNFFPRNRVYFCFLKSVLTVSWFMFSWV